MKNSCFNDEMLADYIEGRLTDDGRAVIERHLYDCETCLDGFVVAEKLSRDNVQLDMVAAPSPVTRTAVNLVRSQILAPDVPLKQRLKRSLRAWSTGLLDLFRPVPWRQDTLGPIRGSKKVVSDDLVHLRKTFKEIETEIEIEKTGKLTAHIRIRLTQNSNHMKGVRATLKKGEREISSHPLIGAYVLFEDIPFGHYELTFSSNGSKLGTYLFAVKESPHDRENL
jgi:hypothetical protein